MLSLTTERLVLRPHVEANFECLHAWRNNSELQRLSSESLTSYSEEQTHATLARWMRLDRDDIVHLAIHLSASDEFIGFLHIAQIEAEHQRCKIGIVIGDKRHWGRGYGSEGIACAVQYCFSQWPINRISAETYAINPGSARMLEKVGFVREGVLRESVLKGGQFVDEYLYGLLRADWAARNAGL